MQNLAFCKNISRPNDGLSVDVWPSKTEGRLLTAKIFYYKARLQKRNE